jgi:hypothetical protein
MVSLRGTSGLLTVKDFLSFFHSETSSASFSSIFAEETSLCVDEDDAKLQLDD